MRLCSLSAITTYKYLFTHIGTVFFPLVALTHDGSSSENWIFDGFFFSFSLDLAYTCRASFHSHTIFFPFRKQTVCCAFLQFFDSCHSRLRPKTKKERKTTFYFFRCVFRIDAFINLYSMDFCVYVNDPIRGCFCFCFPFG